jgi:hypothetical protein
LQAHGGAPLGIHRPFEPLGAEPGLLALRTAALADGGMGVAKLANPANVPFLKANPSIVERLNAIDMGK